MVSSQDTLIVKQPVLSGIIDNEILAALSETARLGPRSVIEIDVRQTAKQALETGDWHPVASELSQVFREKLQPAMASHPDWRISYFGTAPIPLAMYLGFLIDTWASVDTYLRHHERKDWIWAEPSSDEPELKMRNLPRELVRSEGDAIIRVSTTMSIDPRDTQDIVHDPLAEVDIELDPTGFDAVVSMALLDRIADGFKQALDAIAQFRPGTRTVHVFAAVPVGLAFRMGTRISRTIHPRIQTYQFTRTATRRYQLAIALQDQAAPRSIVSAEERAKVQQVRDRSTKEAKRLQALAVAYEDWASGQGGANWLSFVVPERAAQAHLQGHPWNRLLAIAGTPLRDSVVDNSIAVVDDGFRFDRTKRAWQLGDELLIAIARAFPDEEDLLRAIRMLLFHEGVHAGHRLTSATSIEVGRFPKIVEDVDYQADVWGMLHEYKLTRQVNLDEVARPREFFLRLISTITNTLWAFDAGIEPLYEVQIRRLNRYFIWYWQYLHVERATTLEHIMELLSRRPVIELAGPVVLARGDRVYYRLDPRHVDKLELAVLHDNAIHRFGDGISVPLQNLLDGMRTRNGERVKEALRGAFDQVYRVV